MTEFEKIPDDFQKEGYRVIRKISLSGTAAFIEYQFKRHPLLRYILRTMIVLEVLITALLFIAACREWNSWGMSAVNLLKILLVAAALLLLLVPFHEGMHAVFFRLIGARRVRFGIEWRQCLIYAAADRTPLNYPQYRLVALAPFVIVNAVLLVLLGLSQGQIMHISLLIAFFIHLNCCWGDLVMILYFRQYRKRDVITIDDLENRMSYFLEKEKPLRSI